ncbi:MAG: EamA family transporter [Hyphomicrobiaceae bacterium]
METHVFLAMLAAAACHAGWNSILKLKLTPFAALVLINTASAIVVSPLVLFVPFPDRGAWPYLLASLVLHILYYIGLTEAYRAGDLGQVYPIARGGAPLLTAVAAYLWLGEDPGGLGWSGIAVLAIGILMLSFAGRKLAGGLEFRATALALLTAVAISLYTVVDGIGARLSTSTASYIAWLFLLDGLTMLAVGVACLGRAQLWQQFSASWRSLIPGGAMALASYGTAIWAMTVAPIALVAAVRETSVLFAAILGIVVLKEGIIPVRILAAVVVLTGLVMMRLS